MDLFDSKPADQPMHRGATISQSGVYRYTLDRLWDETLPRICWILLNPSTADAEQDDPTNRKGIAFSKRWGFGACVFVNLFAFRSPHPKVMKKHPAPVGPLNNYHVLKEAGRADKVVVAWGRDGKHHRRDAEVLKLLKGIELWCLGTNQDGTPKHPLYLKNSTELEVFKP